MGIPRTVYTTGFTLPEVIIATAIALVLSGTTVLFFARQPSQFSDTITALSSQRQAQRALTIMSRELRGATRGVDGALPLRTTLPDALSFTADVDSDGVTELVTYTANGANLTRSITEPDGRNYPNTPTSTTTLATLLTSTTIFRYPSSSIIEINLPLTSTKLEGVVSLRNLR